jgi:hypothetical protein
MEQANKALMTTFALVLTVTLAVACAGQKSPTVYVTAEAQPPTIVIEPQEPTPAAKPTCTMLVIQGKLKSSGKHVTLRRIFTNDELEAFLKDLDDGQATGLPELKSIDSIDAVEVSCS